jgi:hypothetical protein
MVDGELQSACLPADYMDRMLSILVKLPEKSLQNLKVANAVVEFWSKSAVATLSNNQYLGVWDRLWAALAKDPSEERDIKNSVSYAINDPAGKLTEELFKFLWPKNAKSGGGIPEELADRLKKIVHRTDHSKIDASSIIVGSRTNILHAVAPEFSRENVIPLLRWETNPNAAAYWRAFLWPARISPDLFKLIEPDFITALQAPEKFEEHAYEVLCQMFLLASMEFKATDEETVKKILDEISEKGLGHMSSFLRRRMLNSKDDSSEYWLQTVKPWINTKWPRDADRQTNRTKEDFAMSAIYCGKSFPFALNWLQDNGLIGEIPTASTILYALKTRDDNSHDDFKLTSSLPEIFPRAVLRLLWITRPFQWDHGYASSILKRLIATDPSIAATAEYQTLTELL